MLLRLILFLAIALLIFAPLSWVAYRNLVRIHPRRRPWILAALVAGNLMWPFIPFMRSFTPLTRVARALFGPMWFGWASFTILYGLLLLLILLVWLPMRRRASYAHFARWPSRVFLSILIVGFFAGWYQAVVPLRVDRVTIAHESLPPTAEGTRIALLGDLHVGLFSRRSRLEKIFRDTAALQPDIVFIAGDLLDDDPHFVTKLLEGAAALGETIPLYAVLGNHEMYGDPYQTIEAMRGSRIRLLVNEGLPFGDLWFAGVSDPAAAQVPGQQSLIPDLGKALAGKSPESFPIAVAHQPRVLAEARERGIPIALFAHTHGGQLGIRPLGWSLAGVFLRYHMGLYDVSPTQLYINTGTGYWLFPFRLGMSPEISLIELRRG
jgi:uncharacterized protein